MNRLPLVGNFRNPPPSIDVPHNFMLNHGNLPSPATTTPIPEKVDPKLIYKEEMINVVKMWLKNRQFNEPNDNKRINFLKVMIKV